MDAHFEIVIDGWNGWSEWSGMEWNVIGWSEWSDYSNWPYEEVDCVEMEYATVWNEHLNEHWSEQHWSGWMDWMDVQDSSDWVD